MKPTGGQAGLGEGETDIFFRGFRFGLGFAFTVAVEEVAEVGDEVALLVATGFAVLLAVVVGFTEIFVVGCAVALVVALIVGAGVALLVPAAAELPESANASVMMSEIFLNRVPI